MGVSPAETAQKVEAMKFTALEEYGLRCIVQLARRELEVRQASGVRLSGSASLTIGEIAMREGMTQQYAGKIFRILAKAALVESERGRKGGYRLSRPPESITVLDVTAALGGKMFDQGHCGRFKTARDSCVHTTDCPIRSVWSEIQGMVDRMLARTTLKDLASPEPVIAQAMKDRAVADFHMVSLETVPLQGPARSPARGGTPST
jgi:Rrf2 family protein